MSAMSTLAQVHAMLPGSSLINASVQDAQALKITRVGTDSRQVDHGELFVTLAGERFDAHDFLVENGVNPDLWINLDPRDRTNGIQRLNDHTVYMPASRCPPSTFDYLQGRKVLLWHSWAEGPEMTAIGGGKLAVGGGTTSGLRAVNIGYLLGFRNFTLYGYDSCNRADGVKRFTGDKAGASIDVFVGGPTGRKFNCNLAMAQQANEFQKLFDVMGDITVDARGPGLIAEIMRVRNERKAA